MGVTLGITELLNNPAKYLGSTRARVGVVANYSAVDEHAEPVITRLAASADMRLAALYSAEHGLWGCEQAGIKLSGTVDPHTGAKVHSLYGDTTKPTPEMLSGIDVVLFDANDVGSRYWTYLSTMALVIEAAAETGLPVVITDRPNPLGGLAVEGNILDIRHCSFVGYLPIPIRYGMTFGELAAMYVAESGLNVDLTIVKTEGWGREMLFPDTELFWTATPNMPDFGTAMLYPGTCLFEGTNCSEGRGTTRPFRLIGAPWLDALALAEALNAVGIDWVRFRPAHFRPAFSKHAGEECGGVEVYVTDPVLAQPVRLGLVMLAAVRAQRPDMFQWNTTFIDHLAGGPGLRAHIDAGLAAEELVARWATEVAVGVGAEVEAFAQRRERYLIYQ